MVKIRSLTAIDLSAAQRLREQAGWNQTDDDWRRLLAWSPDGCWVAELDGQIVGTTTVTAYGRRIAWIGMVLVDEAHRRQGIGRALLSHAIAYLERRAVQTIALDSTPEGQPLYARLGFEDAFELARWRGPLPAPAPGARPAWPPRAGMPGRPAWPRSQEADPRSFSEQTEAPTRPDEAVVRPFEPADLASVAAYDARLFGADRAHILGAQLGGHPARCFVAERREQIVGYVLSRPGARAWHLGPLAADHPTTAERLARMALLPRGAGGVARVEAGPSEMVMDVVMPNHHAVTLADGLGLARVRRFIRMTRGASPPAVDDTRLYTSAGPELG
jgi:predicted N-acetyltransferase YhbS